MADRTDLSSLQVIERSQLDIIANKTEYAGTVDNKQANTTPLKSLLSAINSELQISYLMSESATPDLTVNIDSDTIQNPQTLRQRQHSLTKGNFSSGTVVFPAADAGTITVSPGTNSSLSLTAGNFVKMLIQIDEFGQLSVKPGVQGPVLSGIAPPEPDGKHVGIGYVILQNIAGVVQNISNSEIFQFINQNPNLALTVMEQDGVPTVLNVTTLKFPNFTVTDEGSGVVSVEAGGSSSLADGDGNIKLQLKPPITNFTLQSPDLNKWEFSVNEAGEIVVTDSSTNSVTDLKIVRDDGIEVSFEVDNTGLLKGIDPASGSSTISERIFLEAPSGRAWELRTKPLISNFTLQSPDLTLWEVSIDNAGSLVTNSGSTNSPINIKIERDDLTEVGITIDNNGDLHTESPPQLGAVLFPKPRLEAPDLTIWELNINDINDIYTTTDTTIGLTQKTIIYTSSELTLSNCFQIQNDKAEPLFSVREFEEIDPIDNITQREGAFIEMPVITFEELRSIETPSPSSSAVIIEVYLTNPSLFGNAPRKVFYDPSDGEWKYVEDSSILVFP